jgi:hypothetical protein
MFSKRFVDDIWFPMFLGFDTEKMLYDERAEGGSDGVYPSCLQGPMGEIRMPLNLQLQQDQGPVVPFLDVEVHFDPDTRVLWWHHYDKRDHIAAFRGTHTFPHPKSRLQVRSKTGTLTSAMHRFVRASTSAGRFVNKTVKQAKAMLDKGYTWQQVKHRVIMFSKFDESLGSKWIRVRGMILRKLRRQANR